LQSCILSTLFNLLQTSERKYNKLQTNLQSKLMQQDFQETRHSAVNCFFPWAGLMHIKAQKHTISLHLSCTFDSVIWATSHLRIRPSCNISMAHTSKSHKTKQKKTVTDFPMLSGRRSKWLPSSFSMHNFRRLPAVTSHQQLIEPLQLVQATKLKKNCNCLDLLFAKPTILF